VDIARGLVMILMTLDHVRDFFGATNVNPTDPATTTVALFFTRWVTHLCAPTFFVLTGVSAYLALQRDGGNARSAHLVKRGLWLIVLEVVIMRCLAYQFNFDFRVTLLFIVWALGWSMIVLALLTRWPTRVSLALGVGMIVTHNLLDGIPAAAFGAAAPFWTVLHAPGLLLGGPDHFVLAAYSLIPWVGVAALGYGVAPIFQWDAARRRAWLLRAGLMCCAAFVIMRTINGYGDPSHWAPQRSALFTALSFLNTSKYPPSLLFLLMTLGPLALLMRALERAPAAVTDASGAHAMDRHLLTGVRCAVATLGRVPLFYFVLHIALIHLLALLVCYARYGDIHWVFESPSPEHFPFRQPPGWPLGLPYIYALWALVVAMLWPLCQWFARVRATRREWWLRYL
jgi:uncharacterized membrane protein